MKRRRAPALLFAVATGGPVAVIADPGAASALEVGTEPAASPAAPARTPAPVITPVVTPRVLPSGAPACGNVSWKTPIDPACRAAHALILDATGAMTAEVREIGRVLAVFDGVPDRSLTVAPRLRPGS